MREPLVTIIILTWNSRADIDDCLNTMTVQTYSNFKILVVDSHSSDRTAEYVQKRYPLVKVMKLEKNEGYRRGNAIGAKVAEGDFVVICNDDVKVEKTWLAEMVRAMQEGVGLVTPMILVEQNHHLINAAGNTLHYSAMYGPRGKNEPREMHVLPKSVAAVSGCCFMIRRELLTQIGFFSSDFDRLDVGWHASFEDVDLGWRAMMRGYRIAYAPDSVMYHKYKQPEMFPSRFGAYEWGRYLTAFRNYSLLSLLILMPILFFQELTALGYALVNGKPYLLAKWGVMRWLLSHPRDLWQMRQHVQKLRMVPDYKIVRQMDATLSLSRSFGKGSVARAVDFIFRAGSFVYYRLFLCLLKIQSIVCREDKL